MISCLGLPQIVVLMEVEGCTGIHKSIKGNKISHCSHGIVEDDVHVSAMYLGYEVAPILYGTVMTIQEGEIQWPEAIS